VKEEWLAQIFSVMARAPQHTYQILTKRPERMLDALQAASDPSVATHFMATYGQHWPPPNWWFGVSIEDQETANRRLPILVRCKAAVRFVSYEPAIGPVNFMQAFESDLLAIDWIICGGESGSGARPMHPKWARDVRDLCSSAGIPFFFKQWGEWIHQPGPQGSFQRVGKHKSGSHLDGVEWKEFPCSSKS
jgi:protein gp37